MKNFDNLSRLHNRKSKIDENVNNGNKGVTMKLLEKYRPKKDFCQIEAITKRQEQGNAA